jgi:hypothetical protein
MTESSKDRNSKDRYVVFCADGWDYGQPGYIFFTHEADVMMIAAAGEVESGKLTPAEARELLEPYREVLPPLYTGSQQAVFDPDRISWRDPDSFPAADDVQQSPQASQIFWYEVDELGIEGVTLVWSVPFPVLAPIRKKALEELEEAVSDEYEIVVKKDTDEFDAMGKSVEWARKLIEEATTTENPQQSQFFQASLDSGTQTPKGRSLKTQPSPENTTLRIILTNRLPNFRCRTLFIFMLLILIEKTTSAWRGRSSMSTIPSTS